ncbi:MAG: hypothetical protein JSV42_08380 [Chloroflexota bacterium]|nr:MAG: hypothetical protein JSV42_08380 [Chloroflexota bacterium]
MRLSVNKRSIFQRIKNLPGLPFHWRGGELVLASILVAGILILGSGIFGRWMDDTGEAGLLPIPLHSLGEANYGVDEFTQPIPVIGLEIIQDILGIEEPPETGGNSGIAYITATAQVPTPSPTLPSFGEFSTTATDDFSDSQTATQNPRQSATPSPFPRSFSTPTLTPNPTATQKPTNTPIFIATKTPTLFPPTATPPRQATSTPLPSPTTVITNTPNPTPTSQPATSPTPRPTRSSTLAITPTSQYNPGITPGTPGLP